MNKNEKLLKLLHTLKLTYDLEQPRIEEEQKLFKKTIKQWMYRVHVRRMIGGTLDLVDRHTVTGWLNKLLNLGVLTPTETAEYVNKGLYKTMKFMPNCNTKYYIEIDVINALIQKLDTPHTTLDSFNEDNQPCSDLVQKEVTAILKS